LLIATENSNERIVRILVGSGANVNNVNTINDQTPLMVAAKSGNLEIRELLLHKFNAL